jgi:hypothetical protein
MAWETRARGGRYYTHSKRQGRRVVREYLGCSSVAHEAAARDQRQQEARAAALAAWRGERQRLDAAEKLLVAYCAHVERVARDALTAAGFHQHARGEWRRRRGRAE